MLPFEPHAALGSSSDKALIYSPRESVILWHLHMAAAEMMLKGFRSISDTERKGDHI